MYQSIILIIFVAFSTYAERLHIGTVSCLSVSIYVSWFVYKENILFSILVCLSLGNTGMHYEETMFSGLAGYLKKG